MIYDDSILGSPDISAGSIEARMTPVYVAYPDDTRVRYLSMEGGLHWLPEEEKSHGFERRTCHRVPRKRGKDQDFPNRCPPLINSTTSGQQANDVAYFADAYLKCSARRCCRIICSKSGITGLSILSLLDMASVKSISSKAGRGHLPGASARPVGKN